MSRKPLHTTKAYRLFKNTVGVRTGSQAFRDYLDLTVSIYCHCNVSRADGESYVVVMSIFEDYEELHQDLRNIFGLQESSSTTFIRCLVKDTIWAPQPVMNLDFAGCSMVPSLRLVKQRGGVDCCFILTDQQAQ